jgi:hypothetical protein
MSFEYNTTGIAEDTLQGSRLAAALSLSVPELTAIANGAPARHGVDSFTAVLALNVKGPAEKAARAQQAGQQPKPPTVKDQVVAAAQPAPTDTGIGSLNAGNVMTEQGMAAGGIVAFDEGGEVPHFDGTAGSYVDSSVQGLTSQLVALKQRRNALASSLGPVPAQTPGGFLGVKKQIADIDTQIADLENKYSQVKNRFDKYNVERTVDINTPIPFQSPLSQTSSNVANAAVSGTSPTDKTQQTPGDGLTQYKPQTSFPAVDKAMKNLRTAYGQYETFDPMQQLTSFDASQYAQFLPKTAEDISNQRADAEAELRRMYPETREAAEELMAKRYAGLEDMFKKREARGEEALKEAEKEKGQTAGLGLMQLASELVTKPLTKIDTSAAFQTFKDANKEFRQARKDFNAAKDKIDESRELQKIGQSEKADALYREGVKGIFDFKNQTAQLENAQDAAYKSGVLSLADKSVQAQATKLAKKVELGKSEVETALGIAGLQSAERRTAMQSDAEIKKYQMLAPGKERQGYDTAMDNALAQFKELASKNPKLMIDQSAALATLTQLKRQALKEAGYNDEKITQLLGAGSSGVPSVDTSQWGDPKLKQP